MSSVWKRLQRVGKNASKFHFTASFESLTVECDKAGKWQPNKLCVVWTRRKRRMSTKLHTWNPGISNPFRGVIVWAEPEDLEITVTLYKDSRPGSPYEDKEWSFIIEDESTTGRRKPIAHASINMVDYATAEFTTKDLSLKLKLSSKKLVYASVSMQLSCVLIKEGKATDEDMISIGSMMSLNEIGSVRDFDIEPQIATPQPVRSYKRALSGGLALPRTRSFGKKDNHKPSISEDTMSPVELKRTRSRSTTPSSNKYNASDSKDTYMVDRRLSSASQVSVEREDTWEVVKDMSKAEADLIKWCRTCTKGYKGVKIKNTTTCWRDGLAFCAILHHFHPNLIDFDSLDSDNIKENNKLAFDGFEKIGISRLLDPTTMAISSVPDKLSMITYLFQIKTHFTKPEAPVTQRKHKPFKFLRKHGSSSDSHKSKQKEPKLDIIPNIDEDVNERQGSSSSSEQNVHEFSSTKQESRTRTGSRGVTSDDVSSEDITRHASVGRKFEVNTNNVTTPKSVEMNPTEGDNEAKRQSGYNPFDGEDENEFNIDIVEDDQPSTSTTTEINKKKTETSTPTKKEYNPFDDEEDEPQSPTNRLADIITETKQGYNPFDSESDDNPTSPIETKTTAQATAYTATTQERFGYNPFDDEEDQEVEEPSAGSDETSGSTRGYNPFDDEVDDDSEQTTNAEPEKPAFRRTRLTTSGRKIKLPAPKPRGAPYRPQQDQPVAARRKLPPNPKPRPSRPAPKPPGMASKETSKPASIPTFDEWKKTNASQQNTRDQSPAGRTTPHSLSPIRSDGKLRSVSPSGRVFQSRRPAPKPPGRRPETAVEKDKVTDYTDVEAIDESGKTENESNEKQVTESAENKDVPESASLEEIGKDKSEEDSIESLNNKNKIVNEVSVEASKLSSVHQPEDEIQIKSLETEVKTDNGGQGEAQQQTIKESEENVQVNDSKQEDDTKKADNSDIKAQALKVLMEARQKAGASTALPRDRLTGSQATNDTADGSKRSASCSPKVAKKESLGDKDGSKKPSIGPKPPKPPPPSSLREKLKAESERQSRMTAKSRENLQSRRKRDTELDDSKQRPSITKANSLISHTQQRDRKKESSNESLSNATPNETTAEKPEDDPKQDRKSSHVLGHRSVKMKFQQEREQGSTESLEKQEKYEESDNIKRLRAVLNEGKEGKDGEGSGSESEQTKTKDTETSSPVPTPPRRTSQSYQRRRRSRLSSSGSDTSISNQTNSQNNKQTDVTKPVDIPNKSSQESPGETFASSSSPSKKGFVSRAAAAQAYAESRKMKFDNFEFQLPSPSSQPPPKPPRTMVYGDQEGPSTDDDKSTDVTDKKENFDEDGQNPFDDEMNRSIESGDSSSLQDTAEYVKQELEALAQEQAALDKVAAKLEKELRDAMKRKGCEDEEEKLLQSWFILVDKKNELVRRQTELSILEKEDDLERQYEMLNRELRTLLSKEEWEKTEDDKEREASLLQELVILVNKRDQLVQIEDTQVQQMERDEKHIQQVIKSAQLSKDKSECVLQ